LGYLRLLVVTFHTTHAHLRLPRSRLHVVYVIAHSLPAFTRTRYTFTTTRTPRTVARWIGSAVGYTFYRSAGWLFAVLRFAAPHAVYVVRLLRFALVTFYTARLVGCSRSRLHRLLRLFVYTRLPRRYVLRLRCSSYRTTHTLPHVVTRLRLPPHVRYTLRLICSLRSLQFTTTHGWLHTTLPRLLRFDFTRFTHVLLRLLVGLPPRSTFIYVPTLDFDFTFTALPLLPVYIRSFTLLHTPHFRSRLRVHLHVRSVTLPTLLRTLRLRLHTLRLLHGCSLHTLRLRLRLPFAVRLPRCYGLRFVDLLHVTLPLRYVVAAILLFPLRYPFTFYVCLRSHTLIYTHVLRLLRCCWLFTFYGC